jgi:hypothetical protein
MKKALTATKNVISRIPKPTFEKFKNFNEKFSIAHEFAIRLSVIIGIFTLAYYLIKEISANKYVLTTVEVSHSIELGIKSTKGIYANDLRQKIIKEIEKIVENDYTKNSIEIEEAESYSNDPTTINVGGFDLNQLFLYFRSFFNLQNREIKVYVSENDGENNTTKPYSLYFKAGDKEKKDSSFSEPKEIQFFLAKKIVEYNSPYHLGLFLVNQKNINSKEIDRIIVRLNRLDSTESLWEKVFQSNFWEEKKCILQGLRFLKTKYNDVSIYKKIKLNYTTPNEDNCQCILKEINSINLRNEKENSQIDSLIKVMNSKIDHNCSNLTISKSKIDSMKNSFFYRKDSLITLQKNISKFEKYNKKSNDSVVILLRKKIPELNTKFSINYKNTTYSFQ